MSDRLKLHAEPLQEAWLDGYGHLNEAYYLVPFSNATWALQDHFGIGIAYFDVTGMAIYTVESHLRYLKEVRFPATMEIESVILGCDAKRLHFAHFMMVEGRECATFECMALHFDTKAGKTAPFPDAVQEALSAARIAAPPPWAGRGISLERKR